jgi:uncharacterized membrane protein
MEAGPAILAAERSFRVADDPHPHFHVRPMARLRNYFLTGLAIAAPLFLTVYIVRTFIGWIDGWVTPLIPAAYKPDTYIHYSVPGFGVVVALIFITLLGFLTANFVGKRLVMLGESLLARMPIVRNIYSGLKQIFETAVSPTTRPFQKVGLIQFPSKGLWSIVFLTGDSQGEVGAKIPGASGDIVSVFVPTTPTPISGFLVFVKRSEVIVLDMTVEEAAKLVISAGIVAPDFPGRPIPLSEAAERMREAKTSAGPQQPDRRITAE